MRLNHTDILKIFSDLTERNNDKIKTFAHLKFEDEFNSVALNKGSFYLDSPNTGIFYSKSWADDNFNPNKISIDFPALISFNKQMSVGVNFNLKYRFEIYIAMLDVKKDKSWEILMTEMDSYLIIVLRELQKYIYIDSDEISGWFHEEQIEEKISTGTWNNVSKNGWLKERLKSRNLSLTRGYAETPKNLLTVGTALEIQGCL